MVYAKAVTRNDALKMIDYRTRYSKFNGCYEWQIRNVLFVVTDSDISKNRPYLFRPDHNDFAAHCAVRSKHHGSRHAWIKFGGLYSPPSTQELAALLWDLKQDEWGALSHGLFIELCLLYWILRQEGLLSADCWGVVLRNMWAVTWVALHYCLPSLMEDETIKMFEIASDEGFHFSNPTIKSKSQLPETIAVYRGTNTKSPIQEDGYSWSIDPDVARLYLNRKTLWNGTPVMLSAKVRRDDILGFVEGDRSQEAILRPRRNLIDLQREELSTPDLPPSPNSITIGDTVKRMWANTI